MTPVPFHLVLVTRVFALLGMHGTGVRVYSDMLRWRSDLMCY